MYGGILVCAQMILIAVLIWQSRSAAHPLYFTIGLIISALWLLWALWSMPRKTLKIHPSPAEEGVLCKDRAYQYVRHPMYGAVLFGSLVLTWADGTWLTLFCFFALITVLWLKSNLEEKWLRQCYPTYLEFKQNTPRWIPFWPIGQNKNKHWLRAIGYLLLSLLLASLTWQAYESSWDAKLFDQTRSHNIRARTAAELIKAHPQLLILDVRSEWEFSRNRLPNAVNLSSSDPEFTLKLSQLLSQERAVLVYCAGGFRSRQVLNKIKGQTKATKIYHLHRGMMEWR